MTDQQHQPVERRVPFVGITNLRDLGGYPTADGGTTRWGVVFRADALHKLTAEDVEAFGALGVRTVYDLRGDVERTEFPGPFPSLHVPISGRPDGVAAPPPPPEMTTEDGERMMRDMYVGVLEHSATRVGGILRGLADPAAVPAVFHCHGGKDRTGVVAAVLLLALGVDREDVLDDYEATRRYRRVEHQQDSLASMLANGVSPEAAAGVLGTPRWAMAAAVDAVTDVYGGVDAYLTGPAGMTPDELAALRAALVGYPA
jgi:protein-tyrosine phosphatase